MFSDTTVEELPLPVRQPRQTETQVSFFIPLSVKKLLFDVAPAEKWV